MKPETRLEQWKIHESQRGVFSHELYKAMLNDERIYVLTGDLGYGMFDNHKEDFGQRFINCGASEHAMMGIACGLSYEGKIPFVYSVTPFLIYRAFEVLRTYVNHEKTPIQLVGSGRDQDYEHDGYSHDASDVKQVLDTLPNIGQLWPQSVEEIPDMVKQMARGEKPLFISLKR